MRIMGDLASGMAMSKLAIATLFVLLLLGPAVCDNTDDTCATPATCSDTALFPGRGAALIGHTGYVGSNLLRQAKYDGVFNSKNIHEIGEQHWSMVVCAGAPGFKIGANVLKKTLSGMDYSDTTAMTSLINDLSRVRTDLFVLISVTTITAPPHHHANPPPRCRTTAPPRHRATAPPRHYANPPPRRRTTAPPRHRATAPPHHRTTSPPHHHTTAPLRHRTTASPHHRATAPRYTAHSPTHSRM
jgi:hypothetical protein